MRAPLAQLEFDQEDEAVVVGRVIGDLESANADELRDALVRRLRNDSAGLVLDLSATAYLDSAAIELLFDLARRLRTHRQRLRLVLPPKAPMHGVLTFCGIDTVVEIDETTEAAVREMRAERDDSQA